MKKYIFLFICIVASGTAFAQTISEQVSSTYNAKQYEKTVELLEAEIEKQKVDGFQSAQLFYNLGNAYYRVGDVAKAILNYERAAQLAPADSDIRTNIVLIESKLVDQFPKKEKFFLYSWIDSIQSLGSSNSWATIGIIVFIFFIACLTIFVLSKTEIRRKITFYIGIGLLMFVVVANVFAFRQKNRIESKSTAIVMKDIALVYASPKAENEKFSIHSGSKVQIVSKDGLWVQIEIASGENGWVQLEQLEII